jgi:hypothetical protein
MFLKKIIKIVIPVIILAAITYAILIYTDLFPSPLAFIKPHKPKVEISATILKEVKNMSQLLTVCHYDEITVDSIEAKSGSLLKIFTVQRKLVLIVKGKTYAGFDLSHINEQSLTATDSSVQLTISKPKIIDVIVNPSTVETFIEKGTWSVYARTALLQEAQTTLTNRAISSGILARSEKEGVKVFTQFFKSLGFKKVTVLVQ